MYSPGLGRWTSPDALVPNPAYPQSLNRYAYVYNGPVTYLDPDGRFPIVPVLIVAGVVVLKVVDYGWTAYDVYQSGRVLTDPSAGRGEKLLAGLNIALAVAFEAGEPDDEIPVSVPLDDVGRLAVMAGARRALAEGGEEALERYLRDNLGDRADDVLEWMLREAKEPKHCLNTCTVSPIMKGCWTILRGMGQNSDMKQQSNMYEGLIA